MNLTREAPPPPQPDLPPEPLPANKEDLVQFAVNNHRQFDENIWQKNPQAQIKMGENQFTAPSYHNQHHIRAMIEVTKAIIKNGKDIFGLQDELNKWNALHSDQTPLTMDDLETAFEIASAGHDLGNITKSSDVVEQSSLPSLDFSDKYEAASGTPDIEKRSADITEKLIDLFFTTPDEKAKIERLKPLIRHLIMQTVFDIKVSTSYQCFWQTVQFADQIGTYYFSKQSRAQAVAGLLNEMRVRDNPPPSNLAVFLHFPEERARALIPDEKMRNDINTILIASGGNEINKIPEGIFEDTDRQADYLQDITTLLTSPQSR